MLRLNAQYPADVGVLSAYFLNLMVLEPNQVRRPVMERSLREQNGSYGACLASHDQLFKWKSRLWLKNRTAKSFWCKPWDAERL